ncbi:MAG: cytochrome b/b6 domain-containing protein, partial [Syntrophomonadaceae bacterium]|nr:cytochrome b/b6 domain-containing protein [Syntrophomonadaceae bacterium]
MNGKVFRFTAGERIFHWVHAVTFILLGLTGAAMVASFLHPISNIFGGMQASRDVHRWAAAILVISAVLSFSFGAGGRGLRYWAKSSFNFTRDDGAHAKNFLIEFLGGHKPFPPQGKFNGGEKLNSMLTITGMIFIAISGFIMWFAASLPQWMVQWAYPIHSGFALLIMAVFLAHFYLGVLHP